MFKGKGGRLIAARQNCAAHLRRLWAGRDRLREINAR